MTLLSQISTLRGQQEALESRLGSLTQTSDSAMDREREAEDRLDAALSLHAKQISQRQVCMHTISSLHCIRLQLCIRPTSLNSSLINCLVSRGRARTNHSRAWGGLGGGAKPRSKSSEIW